MKEINCIICNSKSDYLDNYKFNVNSDEDHYGVLKIYYCKLCNFAFAHPMPTDEKLNYYYENDEYLPLYVYESGGMIQNYILPISGKGLWSTLFGFVSLSDDFKLVKGITFFQHAETPGLGGEVDNPNFQKQFIDKKIFDENNDLVSVKVVKPGMAKGDYQVDGLSGATITSNGLSNFLKEDLNRYKNFFKI